MRRLVADPEPAVAVAALPGLGTHLANPVVVGNAFLFLRTTFLVPLGRRQACFKVPGPWFFFSLEGLHVLQSTDVQPEQRPHLRRLHLNSKCCT